MRYNIGGDAMDILEQNADYILCLKPAGVISEEPGMPRLLREAGCRQVWCVHRLDRETAGLMVYAASQHGAAFLARAITEGRLEKEYLAVMSGNPGDRGELRDLLFRDKAKNKSYVVDRMRKGVREAVLRYETLERREGLSLVRIRLETGRSHQIRVQFTSRGFPLLGDSRYGSPVRGDLALWSCRLRFPRPDGKGSVDKSVPPPDQWPWNLFSLAHRV